MGLHDAAGSAVAVLPPPPPPPPVFVAAVVVSSDFLEPPHPAATSANTPATTRTPTSTRLSNVVHLRRPVMVLADLRRLGEPSSDGQAVSVLSAALFKSEAVAVGPNRPRARAVHSSDPAIGGLTMYRRHEVVVQDLA